MNKKYRFFYHYRRSDKMMSVHFRNQCIPCIDVICNVPTETKRNKIQPYLVIQGFANNITVEDDRILIS